MDLSNIDIPEIIAFTAGIGGLVKGFLSGGKADNAEAKAKEIEEARAATKVSRDNEVQELRVQIAVLQEKGTRTDARLKEGNEHFVRVENEAKETNGLLREIIGALNINGLSGSVIRIVGNLTKGNGPTLSLVQWSERS